MQEPREPLSEGRERPETERGPEDFAGVREPEWEAGGVARREGIPTAGAVTQDDPEPQYGNSVHNPLNASDQYMTLAAVYENLEMAEPARDELEAKGFAVQIVARRGDGPEQGTPPVITGEEYGLSAEEGNKPPTDETEMGAGTAVGATIGGTAGLLAAYWLIPSPGALAGLPPLITTLAGAGIGSMLGGIIEYGSAESDATLFAGQARRGGVILLVRTPKQRADEARAALNRWGALDIRVP